MQRLGFRLPKNLIMLVAILQLAISQIHIKAISSLFASQVGFYLFLFILFGLLTVFTLISMKEMNKSNVFKTIMSAVGTCATGSYTAYLMWSDVQKYDSIDFTAIQSSLYLIMFGVAVYFLGTIILLGFSVKKRKEA